ncbi:MFS transporter [Paenibacillus taihuensis]|nr:MFS transporter [Paenibacillus taihuensis]
MIVMFASQGLSGVSIYYAEYVLGDKDLVGTLTMVSFLPLLVGMAFLGWVLALGGYVGDQATQSAEAISSTKLLFIYIPFVLVILQLVLLMFYKLDREYPAIMKELNARAEK